MTNEFEKNYEQLNAAQKKAVDTIEGPVMVIAGPGTGKTTILTLRIGNILRKTDSAPENILALTFTESGAFAIRRKLFEVIGASAYKVNIHTFHSFASRIIEKYPDYFPRIIGSSVITEPEQVKIIETAVHSKKIKILKPYGDQSYYIGPILREIQVIKRENISPKDFITKIRAAPPKESDEKQKKQFEKNLELALVYGTYEKELAAKKYYDFEDMLLELIRAMESNKEFKLMLQEDYHYILADEHQDANAAQNRILELLVDFHDSPNLFIVGDDKQAIYRFQGASLENFLYFSKKYKDAVIIDLEHNYRSHQGILDASHSLIVQNSTIPGHEHKKLISLQMGATPIFVTECKTVKSELEYVSQFIRRFMERKGTVDNIAVLYRDNKHADGISTILRAHGIPHRIESDNDILREPDVVKIILLCKAIYDPSDSEALASVLFLSELGCDSAEVAALCAIANKERKPLYKVINSPEAKSSSREIKNSPKSSVQSAYKRLSSWSSQAQTISFADFLHKLIQETNMLRDIVSDANSLERLNILQAFYDHVLTVAQSKKTFYLRDFIEYISIAKDHGISTRRSYTDHVGGVRLMTAHRAKGLEFNHVFIIHAVNGVWGNRTSRNLFTIPAIEHARNVGRIEDERRLFYVAMTRARESVHVSYARSDGEKELLPSQFISEIGEGLADFDALEIDAQTVYSNQLFQLPKPEIKDATSVSILKPEFVSSKFLAQPLSVTHVNNYLKCHWQYFFVNLIRVPQAQTKHQMYGTAIHQTLRTLFEAMKDGRSLSPKQVVSLFKHNLDMQPLAKDDRDESFKKGKTALEGYLKTYSGTWNSMLLTEYSVKSGLAVDLKTERSLPDSQGKEAKMEVNNVNIELTGKLDKIEFIKDNDVSVVDYKTSKPKSKNEMEGKTRGSDGNYKRQLVFYKLLLDGDKKFNMKSGVIDFIQPNDGGHFKRERFEISAGEVEELKKTIGEMVKDVTSLGFVKKTCADKECQYCELGKLLRVGNY